jgi:hypothetical protein
MCGRRSLPHMPNGQRCRRCARAHQSSRGVTSIPHSAVSTSLEREPRLTVGWATKIINVYLKTRVYIGAQGRHHLKEMIHPPIDAGLWLGLARKFPHRPDILERLTVSIGSRTLMTTSATVASLTVVVWLQRRCNAS